MTEILVERLDDMFLFHGKSPGRSGEFSRCGL
jgi:hypothetical protein